MLGDFPSDLRRLEKVIGKLFLPKYYKVGPRMSKPELNSFLQTQSESVTVKFHSTLQKKPKLELELSLELANERFIYSYMSRISGAFIFCLLKK